MTPDPHPIPDPQPDAHQFYVSLWMIGLRVGPDPRFTLPAWLSEGATTILVLYKPFAQA